MQDQNPNSAAPAAATLMQTAGPPPLHPPFTAWRACLILHVLLAGVWGWSYYGNPNSAVGFLTCPWHQWTGWYCPGCGGQRALHALVHGHVLDAMSLNLFAVVIVGPVGVYSYVSYMLQLGRRRHAPVIVWSRRGWTLLAVLAVAFAIARNLPFSAVQWLAP